MALPEDHVGEGAAQTLAPEARSRTFSREDVTFWSDDVPCAAWLYRPHHVPSAPCVIIAHGFDGVREQRLDEYAKRFVEAGISAFVFDYRYFGDSRGLPRQLVSNRAQLDDWRSAIEWVGELRGIDRGRIALWGTSTSAGHVIKLAAEDPRIAAVVVQMPLVDGLAQFRMMPLTQSLRLLWAGLKDQVRAWLGLSTSTIPAAGRPYTLAVVTTPDGLSGLDAITPEVTTWRNAVLPRFTLTTAFYRPGRAARRVKCPVLVCVADADRLIPAKPAIALAKRVERGALRRYRFSHFAMYHGSGFERVVPDQAKFLSEHLADPNPLTVV